MTTIVAITKARTNLGAIVKKIHLEKGYVILEKDGFPVAGMMDIDEFEDYLDARNVDAAKEIASSRKDVGAKRTRSARALLDL
jgi:PHD/YefM family antitoxin component YafN of YafNO toxin-antitoxin module